MVYFVIVINNVLSPIKYVILVMKEIKIVIIEIM